MLAAIIGVFSLGVIAVMVSQVVRAGSQGPAALTSISTGVAGFYNALMK